MSYYTRIAALRDKRGLTQEELADLLGISRAALSHYEKNRRKPDFHTLTKLSDFFNVTIDYLIGRPPQWLDNNVNDHIPIHSLKEEDIFRMVELRWEGLLLTTDETKKVLNIVQKKNQL
ncbi:helix-turn-helix domain-containing protein [Paenibacillus sp. tmac-D7]|uniref:helix-turn-helix domain-containing protein n=1 Tax=Paenibacillus sp. tmac-D7 TaxID=2591462 RepID=UPI0011447544|nr:helix-turn-helix transcriptional regulator [Paenibacillus sp. tmac-D7]